MRKNIYDPRETARGSPSIYRQMQASVDTMRPEFAAIAQLSSDKDMRTFRHEYAQRQNLSTEEANDRLIGLAQTQDGRSTSVVWKRALSKR